ncbi:MAG: long-chain fatty acid--CoA ligase [Rhodospirillales bacterium]|jgi:long-chain acyl-CoA synthetase|nr:long-chain fatty acid--CoA ligase [Rhodospirillales bacterium]
MAMSELKQPYLWEKSYPADIDWYAPITPQDVPALMEYAAAKYGTRPAIDFMDRIYSYGEVAKLVNRAAKGLQAQGLNKGDRIGLMLPNCPAMVISYYAVLKAGGTVVNFNPLYAEEEIRDQIEDSECDVLITLDMPLIYDKAAKMLGKTRLKKIVLASMAEQLPFPKSLLYRLLRRRDIVALPADGRHMSFKNLCANDGRSEAIDINPEEDIAVLQYTGGTTGRPKGAMLTHANLTANVQQANYYFQETKFGEEVMMGVLPLFHVFAMTVVMNFSVHAGAKMILLPRFELETVLKAIHKKRPTFFPAVPTIYIAINNHPGVAAGKFDLTSMQYCLVGGDTLPRVVQEKFESLSGCRLLEGYGLSETSPIALCNPSTGESRAGSLGLPAPGTVVEITDIENPSRVLPQGETGEICITGPQVMRGYWNRKEESEAALLDGRFHTGDVGYMDEDGYTYLIDRLKEIIFAGGYNIYPRHVEEAIYRHPAIEEVTVAGIEDAYRQQTVKAFVKLRAGQSLDAEGLTAFLKDKLSAIEMPKQIEFRDELPKTLIGKLSKKELIAEEAAKRDAAAAL